MGIEVVYRSGCMFSPLYVLYLTGVDMLGSPYLRSCNSCSFQSRLIPLPPPIRNHIRNQILGGTYRQEKAGRGT
jgi:hypothetical protein